MTTKVLTRGRGQGKTKELTQWCLNNDNSVLIVPRQEHYCEIDSIVDDVEENYTIVEGGGHTFELDYGRTFYVMSENIAYNSMRGRVLGRVGIDNFLQLNAPYGMLEVACNRTPNVAVTIDDTQFEFVDSLR